VADRDDFDIDFDPEAGRDRPRPRLPRGQADSVRILGSDEPGRDAPGDGAPDDQSEGATRRFALPARDDEAQGFFFGERDPAPTWSASREGIVEEEDDERVPGGFGALGFDEPEAGGADDRNDADDLWGDSDGDRGDRGEDAREPEETSGPLPLPHWADPPTGEVPRILAGSGADEADASDGLDAWRSVSGRTPRYRSDAGDWDESDFADPDALKDDGVAVGALADHEVDDDAEFAQQVEARSRRGRRRPAAVDSPSRAGTPRGGLEAGDPGDGDTPGAVQGSGARIDADLATRVLTGVGIAVVAIVLIAAGRATATLFVMVVVAVALFELYEGFRRAGYQPATILGVLAAIAAVWVAYKADRYGLEAFSLITALLVVFTMLWFMAEVVTARPIVNIALTIFGFVYVGLLGAFAGLLLSAPDGTGLLLGLAICVVGYDVFGFFIGSQFGRSRMAPRLSPQKTWEGLLGGMAASVILGIIVSGGIGLAPWDDKLGHGLLLGLVVAIMAPLGDLCESMIKRDLGVKDLGTILPGHGGVLDRFDAILFCLPATYYLVLHLGIG